MYSLNHRLRNPERGVAALRSRTMIPQHENSRLALEEFPNDIRIEIPQLGNLGDRVVALFEARLWRLVRSFETKSATRQVNPLPINESSCSRKGSKEKSPSAGPPRQNSLGVNAEQSTASLWLSNLSKV